MEIRFGAVLLLVKILFCFMLDDTGNFGLNLHISLPGTYTGYAKASFFAWPVATTYCRFLNSVADTSLIKFLQ